MAHPFSSRHSAFRVTRGRPAVQFRMTVLVAVTLLIGIGLGAMSIAPQSGWHAVTATSPALAHDAWLVRAPARG